MEHVIRGDVEKNTKGAWKATGVHSKEAIKSGNARFFGEKEYINNTKFYKSKVEVYSQSLADEQLAQKAIAESKNKTSDIPDEKIGWKKKKEVSTFFPDSWDAAKIKSKILEAAENGTETRIDKYGNLHEIGYTNDGIPLEFAVENNPPSVFANFNSKQWTLKN
jgi:hypothetical protein